jgi:hypothetical protein
MLTAPTVSLRTSPARGEAETGWGDVCPPAAQVSAAKLHVLQLEPIKQRLGPRWERLSTLVHKLFEQTLKRTQAPGDNFIATGELSYIVTFHALSPEEAGLACAAVAKDVCEHLFGDDVQDISVRSLVGTVPASALRGKTDWDQVSSTLERTGTETVLRPPPTWPAACAKRNRSAPWARA